MKKSLLISAVFMLLFAITYGQTIPNSGFENWTSMGSYSNPNGWGTMNNYSTTSNTYTATMGTPGNPGSSYLKLTSKTYGTGVINGIAVSGVLDSMTMQPKSGFAYTGRPTSLTGAWQHMIYGISQGSISVTFTRWDAGINMQIPVGSGSVLLSGMAMSWTNFSIPITYTDTSNPDTCIIVLMASGTVPANNDYLWVDNLAFVGGTSGVAELNQNLINFNIFPNPTVGTLNIQLAFHQASNVTVDIVDILGKIVLTKNLGEVDGKTNRVIDVKSLSKGNYIVKLHSNNSTISKKVIIE